MGLDMYLTKKIYLGAQYEHNDTNVKLKITRAGKEIKLSPKISKLEYEVGYWRKANQIHKWFVDNVQDGNDNCEVYEVSEEKLKELRNFCQYVIDDSVLVDEYYIQYLKHTIDVIDTALSEAKELEGSGLYVDFYYQSSW